jgi:hypothetical protein
LARPWNKSAIRSTARRFNDPSYANWLTPEHQFGKTIFDKMTLATWLSKTAAPKSAD